MFQRTLPAPSLAAKVALSAQRAPLSIVTVLPTDIERKPLLGALEIVGVGSGTRRLVVRGPLELQGTVRRPIALASTQRRIAAGRGKSTASIHRPTAMLHYPNSDGAWL